MSGPSPKEKPRPRKRSRVTLEDPRASLSRTLIIAAVGLAAWRAVTLWNARSR